MQICAGDEEEEENMSKKYAILSMDIEDWYHLDYFQEHHVDKSRSMLDGLVNYVDLLNAYNIRTTFFALSELSESAKDKILYVAKSGHEIACHGKHHTRPIMMDTNDFERELLESKETLSNLLGEEITGYRAPCYSIDNERYEIIKRAGFKYSSSSMNIPGHPLYGNLDLSSYDQPMKSVFCKDEFYEFSLSTKKFMGKNIAVSGGGWIRLFPWRSFMKPLIKNYLKDADVYTLYIHPFELSNEHMPEVDGTSILTNVRAHRGLGRVPSRVEQLIDLLKKHGFEFVTFGEMVEELKNNSVEGN